jgi:nucleoside phosphorylase
LIKCAQGPSNAQSAVTRAAPILKPKLVLSVGICATLKPEKAKLGDVVVSSKLSTYDDRKVHADGKVEFRGVKNMAIPKNVADRILYADHGWKPPLKDPSSLKVEVHRDAVMLSGSELVNNVKRRKELADYFQALGLEMEGAGRYKPSTSVKKSDWLCYLCTIPYHIYI